jgi:hypothetical protein
MSGNATKLLDTRYINEIEVDIIPEFSPGPRTRNGYWHWSNAASNAEQKIAVGSSGLEGDSVWVKGEQGDMANENLVRTSVQVTQYCAMAFPPLEPDTLGTLNPSTSNTVVQSPQFHDPHPNPSRWATGIWNVVDNFRRITHFQIITLWGVESSR